MNLLSFLRVAQKMKSFIGNRKRLGINGKENLHYNGGDSQDGYSGQLVKLCCCNARIRAIT